MAFTYSLLASTTVGAGGASSITFNDIPQNYTDLVLVASLRSTRSPNNQDVLGVTFNGNSSSFTSRELTGDGAAASSRSDTNTRMGIIDTTSATASTFSSSYIYIPNYTSNNNKSLSADTVMENNASGAGGAYQTLNAGLWSNATAITSITLNYLFGTSFVQYSSAQLYGIRATEY